MPSTRWDPNPRPFSSLKVFKPKVLFGWLPTVWARISAYWDNGITPQAGSKLRTTPTKILSRSLREWLQGHFVAQTFQSSDQGSANSLHFDPIKVIRAEFPVVSYENTFTQSARVAPRSLCGPDV